MPPYLYRLRPLDRHAEDDERHAGDDFILTYPGHSQANLSARYLSILVSIDLDKQLKISAGPIRGATDSLASAAILQHPVPRSHAGQPLPARRQPMLAGDELHIPHGARPDNGADGDGKENTTTPTELEH